MEWIQIEGGKPLYGTLSIQGSKNAALPLMAAALLIPGTTILKNCPCIGDVEAMAQSMEVLGCKVYWEEKNLVICAQEVNCSKVPLLTARKFRASVLLLGSLLARTGLALVPFPGGCTIGSRPVDFHLKGLQDMGVYVHWNDQWIQALGRPEGGEVTLPMASVGATENLLLAAAGSKRKVTIRGCAKEPEVVCLCRCLEQMGMQIDGIGTECLTVTGMCQPKEVTFCVPGDRIIAGTYLLAVAAAGGRITLENITPGDLEGQVELLEQLGLRVYCEKNMVSASFSPEDRKSDVTPIHCVTAPYPGFPTDLQSQFMAVAAGVPGVSIIEEKMFEKRFQTAEELRKMGACISVEEQRAEIKGVEQLRGAKVEAKELRGGAALVVAGLGAKGTTKIFGVEYIQRGYEDMVRDLGSLGADICMKQTEDEIPLR